MSKDPLGEKGGKNLYGFVGNDGVSGNDFLGLEVVITQLKTEEVEAKGEPFTTVKGNVFFKVAKKNIGKRERCFAVVDKIEWWGEVNLPSAKWYSDMYSSNVERIAEYLESIKWDPAKWYGNKRFRSPEATKAHEYVHVDQYASVAKEAVPSIETEFNQKYSDDYPSPENAQIYIDTFVHKKTMKVELVLHFKPGFDKKYKAQQGLASGEFEAISKELEVIKQLIEKAKGGGK